MIKHVFFSNNFSKEDKVKSVYDLCELKTNFYIQKASVNKTTRLTRNNVYHWESETFYNIINNLISSVLCSITGMKKDGTIKENFREYWEYIIIENN